MKPSHTIEGQGNQRFPVTSRPWGRFETFAAQRGWLFKRLIVEPRRRLSLQYHRHRAEYWVAVRGEGIAWIGERQVLMRPGKMLYVPVGVAHRIENTHPEQLLEVLEIQLGALLSEDDIVRLADDYGRVCELCAVSMSGASS